MKYVHNEMEKNYGPLCHCYKNNKTCMSLNPLQGMFKYLEQGSFFLSKLNPLWFIEKVLKLIKKHILWDHIPKNKDLNHKLWSNEKLESKFQNDFRSFNHV